MIINQPQRLPALSQGSLKITLNEAGSVYQIQRGPVQLNAYKTPAYLNGPFEIYLREKNGGVVALFHKAQTLSQFDNGFLLEGEAFGKAYRLEILLARDDLYFFRVVLGANEEGLYDLLFVHDLGLADEGAIRSNELYASQYVDHHLVNGKDGYVILSRQNMGKPNPGLAIGSNGIKCAHFATDLLQLYTTASRRDGLPVHLRDDLPDVNRQYELGAAILQTETFSLKKGLRCLFYGLFTADEPQGYQTAPSLEKEKGLFDLKLAGEKKPLKKAIRKDEFPFHLESGLPFTEKQLRKRYPDRLAVEEKNGRTLSFFLQDGTHLVSQAKDLINERPEANILYRYPRALAFEKDSYCVTGLMDGAFAEQLVVGNTSLNKLTPPNRGLLDLPHSNGLRLLIKKRGRYVLLGEPSLFEMGLNHTRWIYLLDDDEIQVLVELASEANAYRLRFSSQKNKNYDLIVYFEAVLGEHERLQPFEVTEEGGHYVYSFANGTFFHDKYPKLNYVVSFDQPTEKLEEGLFYRDGETRLPALQLFHLTGSQFSLRIDASLNGEKPAKDPSFGQFSRLSADFGNLNFVLPKEKAFAEKLNLITPWFLQGALIHFLVPHGLEQTGGAAWGTRDVAQGPYELFSGFGRFEAMRQLILDLYSHQNPKTGEWPQWFMLDNYAFGADDCHGDVVFWPLNILADYLSKTGDAAILEVALPSQNEETKTTVAAHLAKALANIQGRFIPETDLLCYGGGDWDDTLQPADQSLKSRLVSPWTQELAYEVLSHLAQAYPEKAAEKKTIAEMASRVRQGYEKALVYGQVIPGFVYVEKDGSLTRYVLPGDEKTGIHYRLLPYTRAILSGLAPKEDAFRYAQLIEDKLLYPDGVRLMDRPARYNGGVSTMFVRAEEAANVGREISLCYVHAEVRYVETLCALGEGKKAFSILEKIIPIGLDKVVPNALPRQANAYFSSSDPLFNDRYEFAKGLDALKKGQVSVNGGWRVYSSGNGIFLARLLGDFFGLRIAEKELTIDPVLPSSFDQAEITVTVLGKKRHFLYHLGQKGSGVTKVLIDGKPVQGQPLHNSYRKAGLLVPWTTLEGSLIEIFTE